jgi:rRNA pseudouridine-1189 N-methylase Emg1 (Nep1/Mra1 family)
LYVAALFESDKEMIPQKIAQAQRAIRIHRRRLLEQHGSAQERQALDNALFSLQALRSCLASSFPAAA